MVHRTTIVLPSRLKEKATARAREQNISFGEFVRRAVEKQLAVRASSKAKNRGRDPYLDNLVVFDDDGPADLSVRIDEFLYGDHR
jgi:hypothetical protein